MQKPTSGVKIYPLCGRTVNQCKSYLLALYAVVKARKLCRTLASAAFFCAVVLYKAFWVLSKQGPYTLLKG